MFNLESLSKINKKETESLNQPESQEKPKAIFNRNRIPAALTGIALSFAAFMQEPTEVRAAEIPEQASWAEGMSSLKQSVFKKNHEEAAFFATDNTSSSWLGINTNLKSSSVINFETQDVIKKADTLDFKKEERRICMIHTHPVTVGQEVGMFSAEEASSMRNGEKSKHLPPSLQDVIAEYNNPEISMVAEPGGIWYTQPVPTQSLEQARILNKQYSQYIANGFKALNQESLKLIYSQVDKEVFDQNPEKTIRQLVKKNKKIADIFFKDDNSRGIKTVYEQMSEKLDEDVKIITFYHRINSPSQEDYQRLLSAYQGFGSKVRFVPWEDVDKEPPCAGPDYKPVK